ncbi:tRNA (guanine-N(7)-)-methyltransferase (tRNA(m7G46)-methyltransferase) [Gurleya vavrai]
MDIKPPRKKDFLQRAHSNPFLDTNIFIPSDPDSINWSDHFINNKKPTILDLGCGYGRFLFFLAQKFKNENILGMEIRNKVVNYVNAKINSLKTENDFNNISAIHTNGMIFLQNFFDKNTLEKIFILFPDPHFKNRKKKARIVCKQMVHIYSYVLKINGKIYISTDVEELFGEMEKCFVENDDFDRVNDELEEFTGKVSDEASRAGARVEKVFTAVFMKIK